MPPPTAAPILLVGSAGMLGRAFREMFTAAGVEHNSADVAEMDIRDLESVRRCVGEGRRLVINCAAWTDVDAAEANEAAATAVNGTGAANLAAACRERDATLVHYSTDYVFNGAASAPYPVDAKRAPIGAYGRSKAAGEVAIERELSAGLSGLIIRTSWLYAPWGKNFVRTIAGLAKGKPTLRVVNDQRGRPTSAEHLARVTLTLVARRAEGMVHVTDGGECTWFDFAAEIVRLAGFAGKCAVEPCTSAEYPRPARRPAYSVLDLGPAEQLVGPMRPWRENLADVMGRLEQ